MIHDSGGWQQERYIFRQEIKENRKIIFGRNDGTIDPVLTCGISIGREKEFSLAVLVESKIEINFVISQTLKGQTLKITLNVQ
jgi:hypothetical protein